MEREKWLLNDEEGRQLQHRFDSYLKKSIKNAATNMADSVTRRFKREIFVEKMELEKESGNTEADEWIDDCTSTVMVSVGSISMKIHDEELAEALKRLENRKT